MCQIIKHFEGFRSEAYQDSTGIWTIGYGHTKGVKKGMIITKEEGSEYLKQDLQDAEDRVKRMFPDPMPKNEWDVLVSLAYNLASFEALAKHLIKDRELFKKKMLLYYRTKGSERGLKRRRIAERLLFEGRDWKTIADELDGKSLGEMILREKELFA